MCLGVTRDAIEARGVGGALWGGGECPKCTGAGEVARSPRSRRSARSARTARSARRGSECVEYMKCMNRVDRPELPEVFWKLPERVSRAPPRKIVIDVYHGGGGPPRPGGRQAGMMRMKEKIKK